MFPWTTGLVWRACLRGTAEQLVNLKLDAQLFTRATGSTYIRLSNAMNVVVKLTRNLAFAVSFLTTLRDATNTRDRCGLDI